MTTTTMTTTREDGAYAYYKLTFGSGELKQANYLTFSRKYQNIKKSPPINHMSCIKRKPDFCLSENCTADQRLCFCYTDSTIPILLTSEISSFFLATFFRCTGQFFSCCSSYNFGHCIQISLGSCSGSLLA